MIKIMRYFEANPGMDFQELPDASNEEKKVVENRKITDQGSLYVLVISLIVVIASGIYTLTQGDLYRLLNGYDNYGNVCGKNNEENYAVGISLDNAKSTIDLDTFTNIRTDLSNSKYFIPTEKKCVEKCPPEDFTIFHFCYKRNESYSDGIYKSFIQDFAYEIYYHRAVILIMCLAAIVIAMGLLAMFYCVTKFTIWFVLIFGVLCMIGITAISWIIERNIRRHEGHKDKKTQVVCILLTLSTVALALVLFTQKKKIHASTQLIKESGKIIRDIPSLLVQPILTFLLLTMCTLIWIYFIIVASSAGTLQKNKDSEFDYYGDGTVQLSIILSCIAVVWIYLFLLDIQYMVIAGSISRWFFNRNKNNLQSLVLRSTYVTCCYHLGTLTLGTIIFTFANLIKTIYKPISQRIKIKFVENKLKYYKKEAYAITAIYGDDLLSARYKASDLMEDIDYDIATIQFYNTLVLSLAEVFIFMFIAVLNYLIFMIFGDGSYNTPFVVILLLYMAGIGHIFISIYEMIINTIFVCFAEDYKENDGQTKPYYMSKEFLEFVQNTDKLLKNEFGPITKDTNEPNDQIV